MVVSREKFCAKLPKQQKEMGKQCPCPTLPRLSVRLLSFNNVPEGNAEDVPCSTQVPISPLSPSSSVTKIKIGFRDKKFSNFEDLIATVLELPFNDVRQILCHLDPVKDEDLLVETTLHFSLKIYGLPECSDDDLPLAVYLFIEDTFGIQSKIKYCKRLHEEGHSNVVGVMFDTINMKYRVLKNNALLDGTEVQIKDNKDLRWITSELTKECYMRKLSNSATNAMEI